MYSYLSICMFSWQLLWEVAHRKEPYSEYTVEDENQWYFDLQKLKRKGKPPGKVQDIMPTKIKEILESTLQKDRKKRPSAKEWLKKYWGKE